MPQYPCIIVPWRYRLPPSLVTTRAMAAGNMPFAVCKNVFYITCRNDVCGMQKCFLHTRPPPRRKPLRGPGRRTACGRPNGLVAGTPCGRIMHPNQELVPWARADEPVANHAPQSRAAGPRRRGRLVGASASRGRSPQSVPLTFSLFGQPALPIFAHVSAPVSAPFALAPRVIPGPLGVPDRPARAGGAKRTWAAH